MKPAGEERSMRRYSRVPKPILLSLVVALCLPSIAAKKAHYGITSFAKYVQIPGATPVGAETCTTCHSEVAKDFRHAFHAQQGIECEQCHGPGSLHVEGGGDVSKIISFSHRSATDANGVCLSCHAQDAKVRNWIAVLTLRIRSVVLTAIRLTTTAAKLGRKPRRALT